MQEKDHGERLVRLLCKPLPFFCFLCNLSPCIRLNNSINLMLHISCALSYNAFSLMHKSPNYDRNLNCCHNLYIFIHLMLASFSLVEILRAVTKFRQIEKENSCTVLCHSWNMKIIISHGSHAVLAMKKCDTCASLLFC